MRTRTGTTTSSRTGATRTRLTVLLAVGVAALGPLVVVGAPATAARGYSFTFVGDADYWAYRQVAHGRLPGFESGEQYDNGFQDGQAGFGTTDPRCPSTGSAPIHTAWRRNRDLLARTTFYIPDADDRSYVTSLQISGVVDHAVDVYIDGDLVGHAESRGCTEKTFRFTTSDFDEGFNVLAMRASGDGPANIVDLRMTGVIHQYD